MASRVIYVFDMACFVGRLGQPHWFLVSYRHASCFPSRELATAWLRAYCCRVVRTCNAATLCEALLARATSR